MNITTVPRGSEALDTLCGFTGGCEPPDVDAGNQTQVLCKSSLCSYPVNHLSAPKNVTFILNSMYEWDMWVCNSCAGAREGQRRPSSSLKLELQAV